MSEFTVFAYKRDLIMTIKEYHKTTRKQPKYLSTSNPFKVQYIVTVERLKYSV